MVGRRMRSKAEENRSITPDEAGRGSPRSRKCLDLDPRGRPSPLSERSESSNGWNQREEFTPQKGGGVSKPQDSIQLRDEPEPSSPDMFPRTPASVSCRIYRQVSTPRSMLNTTPSRTLLISTPKHRPSNGRSTFVIPDQFRRAPSSARKEKPEPEPVIYTAIETKSFYKSTKRLDEDEDGDVDDDFKSPPAVSKVSVKSQSEPRRQVSQGPRRSNSFKKARKSLTGIKRKREGTNKGGFGHAIKRPKKKRKVDIKISQLPAMSIEIPGSKNAAKTPKTPTSKTAKTPVTPKTGNFALSAETCVDYEVKGGQIVYRKGNTPLRRSPRKSMSPLKQSYFEGSKPKARANSKLFSPQANFLLPEVSSPQKYIPSPVKFSVSTDDDDTETNISDLITRLGDEEESDDILDIDPGMQLDMVGGKVTSSAHDGSRVTSAAPSDGLDPAATAAAAVQDILGELKDTESESSMSQSSEEEMPEDGDRMFPIFYKETAVHTDNNPRETRATGRRGFLCQDPNQMQIDAGQERGPTLCLTCGTVYTIGDAVDEASHEQQHNGVVERLKFPGWRNERNCGEEESGRMLMVQPGDPRHMWKKVEDALSVVDRDLGFSEVGIRHPDKTKVFLYISDKKIVGFLLAEAIEKGFRVITQTGETGKVYMSSDKPNIVKCGVSRIWVLSDYRRRGIASKLVECMRSLFILGNYLTQDQLAFSDPTPNGMDFASNYMKRPDFLVYSR